MSVIGVSVRWLMLIWVDAVIVILFQRICPEPGLPDCALSFAS